MSIKTEGAGTHGTLMPFPLGEKVSSDFATQYDKLLGMVVEGPKGRKFRLVKYAAATALAGPAAAGANVAGARLFAVATGDADDVTTMFNVTPAQRTGTIPLNRPIGAALKDQVALNQNDYFWLQFDGDYMDLWMGDDGTDALVGEYAALDDDADLGCIYTLDTTFTPEFLIGTFLETYTGVDQVVKVRPYKPLNG